MKAKSIKGNSTEEIQSALQQSITDNFIPTLAIVFISVKQNREEVCELLNKEGISIFGATTSGEFIGPEISAGGTAIMLLNIDPSCYKIVFRETGDSSSYEVSKQVGIEGRKLFSSPAFIIASGWLQTDGEQIVAGIEEGIGRVGDKIRLTLPPDFEIVEEVSSNAEKIKQDEVHEADALLMFSCVGRLGQFGPLIGDEIEGVRKVFNVPMAGFFTYGEFGRTKNGNNEFHASTCCWVALKEK